MFDLGKRKACGVICGDSCGPGESGGGPDGAGKEPYVAVGDPGQGLGSPGGS